MSQRDFNNVQLVTIAVAQLGGASHPVDREDIAVQVNSIAPGKFTWRKYPDQIDLVAITYALGDAAKARYGSLVVRDLKGLWMLSPAGVKWVDTLNPSEFSSISAENMKPRPHSTVATIDTERARLLTTQAYELFVSG